MSDEPSGSFGFERGRSRRRGAGFTVGTVAQIQLGCDGGTSSCWSRRGAPIEILRWLEEDPHPVAQCVIFPSSRGTSEAPLPLRSGRREEAAAATLAGEASLATSCGQRMSRSPTTPQPRQLAAVCSDRRARPDRPAALRDDGIPAHHSHRADGFGRRVVPHAWPEGPGSPDCARRLETMEFRYLEETQASDLGDHLRQLADPRIAGGE
jgi:hypothetical protein